MLLAMHHQGFSPIVFEQQRVGETGIVPRPEYRRRNEEQRAELLNALDKLMYPSYYDACKELYENILDKEKCKEIGQRVRRRSGATKWASKCISLLSVGVSS